MESGQGRYQQKTYKSERHYSNNFNVIQQETLNEHVPEINKSISDRQLSIGFQRD